MSLFHIVELEDQNCFGIDEIIAKKYIQTLEDHIKSVGCTKLCDVLKLVI